MASVTTAAATTTTLYRNVPDPEEELSQILLLFIVAICAAVFSLCIAKTTAYCHEKCKDRSRKRNAAKRKTKEEDTHATSSMIFMNSSFEAEEHRSGIDLLLYGVAANAFMKANSERQKSQTQKNVLSHLAKPKAQRSFDNPEEIPSGSTSDIEEPTSATRISSSKDYGATKAEKTSEMQAGVPQSHNHIEPHIIVTTVHEKPKKGPKLFMAFRSQSRTSLQSSRRGSESGSAVSRGHTPDITNAVAAVEKGTEIENDEVFLQRVERPNVVKFSDNIEYCEVTDLT